MINEPKTTRLDDMPEGLPGRITIEDTAELPLPTPLATSRALLRIDQGRPLEISGSITRDLVASTVDGARFKISARDFLAWLKESGLAEEFLKDLQGMAQTDMGEPLVTSWVSWRRFYEVISGAEGPMPEAIRLQIHRWPGIGLDEVYFDFYENRAMNEPTVLLISGQSGSGKTTALQTIIRESPETRIGLLSPGMEPDWSALDVVAVDEDWDPSSLVALELEALTHGKRILAVVQDPAQIAFASEPAIFKLEGACARVVFSYQGRELAFP